MTMVSITGRSAPRSALLALCSMASSASAWADKYGVNEAIAEGDGDLSDMLWGALLVGGLYWLWKKFFG